MMIRDTGKLALFALIILGLMVLRGLGELDPADFRLFLGVIIAYLVGNGVQAIRGKAPSPVIVPSEPTAMRMFTERMTKAEDAAVEADHERRTE